MDNLIQKKFEEMGARVNIGESPQLVHVRNPNSTDPNVTVNIINDKKGQIFDIRTRGKVDISIIDLRPDDRHLVMLAKLFDPNNPHIEPEKVKFLCGHDEREWFSCQLPNQSVTNVETAKLALLPKEVHEEHNKKKLKPKDRIKRRNKASLRQGEWLFVPSKMVDPPEELIHHNEPLQISNIRGGSKPHMAQYAYRTGGTQVYIPSLPIDSRRTMSIEELQKLAAGLTGKQRNAFLRRNKDSNKWTWTAMMRDPKLYVKGSIRHPDHATLELRKWHRVYMNAEVRGKYSVFLD
jgi:hypothetical protein